MSTTGRFVLFGVSITASVIALSGCASNSTTQPTPRTTIAESSSSASVPTANPTEDARPSETLAPTPTKTTTVVPKGSHTIVGFSGLGTPWSAGEPIPINNTFNGVPQTTLLYTAPLDKLPEACKVLLAFSGQKGSTVSFSEKSKAGCSDPSSKNYIAGENPLMFTLSSSNGQNIIFTTRSKTWNENKSCSQTETNEETSVSCEGNDLITTEIPAGMVGVEVSGPAG